VSAAKTLGPVNVTATAAYDFYIDAAYAELAVDKTFALNDSTSLVLKAAAGYSLGGYSRRDQRRGLQHRTESVWSTSSSTPPCRSPSTTFTLTPYVAYNI
jgi:hypothetical protein